MTVSPGLLSAAPLVSVAGFKAHPTYLDLQNLRSLDSSAPDQDRELNNILWQASEWAQNQYCKQPLQAHLQTDTARLRVNSQGELFLYPSHTPARRLISYQYQVAIGAPATTATNPAYWVEDGRQIIVQLGGAGYVSWGPGPLQLGTPPAGRELLVSWSYVTGYCNTLLAATASTGTSSITVADPTGLEPGDTFRIWEPGKEEACVVAASYQPAPSFPPVPTSIPLAAPLQFTHTVTPGDIAQTIQVSNLPADAYLGVVYLAIDILQRYGSSDPNWPGMPVPSATKKRDTPSNMWLVRAMDLLAPYQDVR